MLNLSTLSLVLVLALAAMPHGEVFGASGGPEDVEWLLVEVGGAPVSPLPGTRQPFILLDKAQKKASGFAGCNTFFVGYTLDGASLKFGPVGSTRMACPGPEAGLEAEFFKALDKVRGWKIKEGELLLQDGSEVLARFSQKRGKGVAADPKSMTYRLKSFPSGTVTLTGGEYRGPAAPGSASEITVKLSDKNAFGIVSGEEAAAVVLVTSAGGTGVFSDLALLSRGAKGWENRDTIFLGDRVAVQSIHIENNLIIVDMKAHGTNDPMCCPTLQMRKRFAVNESRLVPFTEGTAAGEPVIVGTVWQWVQTLYNNDTKTAPAKPENYTVQFLEDGKLKVKADCNMKGGTYSTDGKKLSIKITHSTMAACETGSLEDRFVRDLAAGTAFFLQDGYLYLDVKYDTGTMKFSKRNE
jgi:heat shock protein HslJ